MLPGMRQTAQMQGALRRTQILNYTMKSGGLVSNAFGTVAVSYSLLHCLLANGKKLGIVWDREINSETE